MRRPFVDTHVHFWDLKDPALHYSWLQPEVTHPLLGNIDGIKSQRYTADELVAESRFHGVTKAVHVQAAVGTTDPVEETRWLQEQADRTGFPHGIVAHCDLAAPDASEQLARHLAHPNVRGIRDFGHGDFWSDPAWRRGYGRLAEHELVACVDITWEDMAKARGLADEHEDVLLCLDHAGFPLARTDEYLATWRSGLETLAGAENVICKISGLGMGDPRWTAASIRPLALACIEIFGVRRCVLGTNWPVDRLYSSYGDVLDAYDEITAELSDDERTALFSGNAERIFRL